MKARAAEGGAGPSHHPEVPHPVATFAVDEAFFAQTAAPQVLEAIIAHRDLLRNEGNREVRRVQAYLIALFIHRCHKKLA